MWLDVVLFLSLRLCHVHLRCVERAGAFGLPPPLEGRNQNKTPYSICDWPLHPLEEGMVGIYDGPGLLSIFVGLFQADPE